MRKQKKSLRNELNVPQKAVMYLVLLVIVLIMALPMWNVIVVSTPHGFPPARAASSCGGLLQPGRL